MQSMPVTVQAKTKLWVIPKWQAFELISVLLYSIPLYQSIGRRYVVLVTADTDKNFNWIIETVFDDFKT